MALNTKTIEYAFAENYNSVASTTKYTFDAITLAIYEISSRTFKSVMLETYCMDDVTSETNLTANAIGIKLGSAGEDNDSDTVTISTSGENNGYYITRDVTSYFNTNFGSEEEISCQASITMTGPSTINHCAKLIITYDYDEDDSNPSAGYADNRLKTVRIPLESGLTALTADSAEIGTNQVPALDTLLPEDGKVYKSIWFQIEGNDICVNTTDFSHRVSLDAEAEVADGTHEAGLSSARWFRRIWVRNDMATNSAHAFKMSVTNVAGGTCNHLSIVLYVTYSYENDTTTTVMNSLAMPITVVDTYLHGTASTVGDRDVCTFKFFIPDTPTLVQSGVQLFYHIDAAANLLISAGEQSSYRTYVDSAAMYCGCTSLSHRLDSGSQYGAGVAVSKGENTLTLNAYSSGGAIKQSSIGGILYLNYTSSVAGDGEDVQAHTIILGTHFRNSTLLLSNTATVSPSIIPTEYWLVSVGVFATSIPYSVTLSSIKDYGYYAQRANGEGSSIGWKKLAQQFGSSDAESGVAVFVNDCSSSFKRHPLDTEYDRLNIETSRVYSLDVPRTLSSASLYITYHAKTYTLSGTLVGYSGDGSGITVDLFRVDTNERISSTTSSAGGGYSFTVYDDSIYYYASSRQDTDKIGRSDNSLAS